MLEAPCHSITTRTCLGLINQQTSHQDRLQRIDAALDGRLPSRGGNRRIAGWFT
jgi:hypothetical protein